jgi:sugar transferase (PEP-CTERM system associated)
MRFRVVGQYVNLSIAILSLIEALVFFGALYVAGLLELLTEQIPREADAARGPLLLRALLFSAVMTTSLLAFGLYSIRQRAQLLGMLLRLGMALVAGVIAVRLSFLLVPDRFMDGGVVTLGLIGGVIGTGISRLGFSFLVDEEVFKRRVLVYGGGSAARTLTKLRRRADRRGFALIGFMCPEGEHDIAARDRVAARPNESLPELCTRLGVAEIVIAMDDRRRAFPMQALLDCRLAGIAVTELPTFLERETGRMPLDLLNPTWVIFAAGGFRRHGLRRLTSRAFDVVASVLVLLVALPAILLTALAIRLEDGWRAPVLYRQERVGLGGRTFQVLKFRSMHVDAERDGRAQWAQTGDSRVTRVGAVIRKLRFDELPQVINVLRGDMGMVGPRPERPEFVAQLARSIPYYELRNCVRPGITGWAQLCFPYGSSHQDAVEKLRYDLYYLKHNSLLFDAAILLQTAEVVFLGKGAR